MGLVLFAASGELLAETMRCGVHLIETGNNKAEVDEQCGRPVATDSYCKNIVINGKYGSEVYCRRVDVWTYNFGRGSFLMNVEFEEGRVATIYHGDRVD